MLGISYGIITGLSWFNLSLYSQMTFRLAQMWGVWMCNTSWHPIWTPSTIFQEGFPEGWTSSPRQTPRISRLCLHFCHQRAAEQRNWAAEHQGRAFAEPVEAEPFGKHSGFSAVFDFFSFAGRGNMPIESWTYAEDCQKSKNLKLSWHLLPTNLFKKDSPWLKKASDGRKNIRRIW